MAFKAHPPLATAFMSDIDRALELHQAGRLAEAEVLIVTRGEHGSWIYEGGGKAEVSSVTPHRIVDPTGVGDSPNITLVLSDISWLGSPGEITNVI